MNAVYRLTEARRFSGYRDLNGQFVPFSMADEVFVRARSIGARVLLRLALDDKQELNGIFYTNDQGLSA